MKPEPEPEMTNKNCKRAATSSSSSGPVPKKAKTGDDNAVDRVKSVLKRLTRNDLEKEG